MRGVASWACLLALLFVAGGAHAADRPSELIRENSGALVFIENAGGSGSGFVCTIAGRKFVVTNQHVIAGSKGLRFTLLDREPLKTGAAAAAVGHDIMSFAADEAPQAMEMMTSVEKEAVVGDAVVVLGNAEGARVINPLVGKLVGIGPNLVEVSAEFMPGNSGSPIVHLKSGKVIGVATYAVVRQIDSLTGRRNPRIRRFGFRLDSVKRWQPVAWPVYDEEFQTISRIQERTGDLAALLNDLAGGGRIVVERHKNDVIRRPLEKFIEATSRSGVNERDRDRAVQDLMATMRSACQRDVEQAKQRVRYDYFARALGEEAKVRAEFFKVFDAILKEGRR